MAAVILRFFLSCIELFSQAIVAKKILIFLSQGKP